MVYRFYYYFLLHDVISLPDATSYDNGNFIINNIGKPCALKRESPGGGGGGNSVQAYSCYLVGT